MTVAGLPARGVPGPAPRGAARRRGLAAGALARPRALTRRPQLVAEAGAVAAWLLLLAHPLAVAAGVHAHDRATVASWAVMAAAMMLPGVVPVAFHVGVNSLRRRRHRAVALYVAAYLAVWVAFGAVALALPWRPALPVVLGAAAAWQVTAWHAAALRACHRTVPLPPTGWRAVRGDVRFGLRTGAACVGTCWAVMLVMLAAPAATHVAWTAALAVAAFAQKAARRPRHTSRRLGAALGVAALLALPGGTGPSLLGAAAVLVAVTPRRRPPGTPPRAAAWPVR